MREAKTARLCETCAILRLTRADFEKPPFEPDEKYKSVVSEGSLEALRRRRSRCQLCQLIWHALLQNELPTRTMEQLDGKTRWQMIWMQSTREFDPNDDCKEEYYGSALYPEFLDVPDSNANYAIQLVDDPDTSAFLRARSLPAMLDLDLVKSWLDRCSSEHGSDCAEPAFGVPGYPGAEYGGLFVVDVQRDCVVPLPPAERYVCLSYVWGASTWSRMDRSNFDRFKQPGSIKKSLLPRTITDAIAVVITLDFRYLWVDFLCIDQNPAIKPKVIRDMDAIFYHAHLCIVAASGGDADSGLSGWSSTSRSQGTTMVKQLSADLRLGVLPFLDGELMHCEHAQRAWTFQEGVLSTRRLVFMNGFVHFACRSATWREDMHAELGDLVVSAEGADVFCRQASAIPLHMFGQYLRAYTDRNLTFAYDVMNAFAGMQRAISQSLNGTRFWYGIPASAFDWALLWSKGGTESLERRPGFPSWSWTGWKGYTLMANDHYSEFDQEWLQTRTWIEWDVWDGSDGLVSLWDPDRDGTIKNNVPIDSSSHHVGRSTELGSAENTEATDADEKLVESDSESGIETCIECPQYGWPVAENRYGRIKSDHGLPARGVLRRLLAPSNILAGTLRFLTVSATFEIETQTLKQTGHASYFWLKDRWQRLCGIIWDDGISSVQNLAPGSAVQILVLSEAALGTTLPFHRLEAMPLCADQDAPALEYEEQIILGERHKWNMYNVMLVVKTTSIDSRGAAPTNLNHAIHERRGVGLLYKSALRNALAPGPLWEEVYLS